MYLPHVVGIKGFCRRVFCGRVLKNTGRGVFWSNCRVLHVYVYVYVCVFIFVCVCVFYAFLILTIFNTCFLDAKRQFKKYKTGEGDTLGAKYDADSIMHYSNKAFTKNGQDTISYRKDPSKRLGQRDHLSKIDIAQLNQLYR